MANDDDVTALPPPRGLVVPIHQLAPSFLWLTEDCQPICHGETQPPPGWQGQSAPDTQIPGSMPFHLAIARGGTRLFLFRSGYLPQELVISDLVNAWLLATGSPPLGVDETPPLTDEDAAYLAQQHVRRVRDQDGRPDR